MKKFIAIALTIAIPYYSQSASQEVNPMRPSPGFKKLDQIKPYWIVTPPLGTDVAPYLAHQKGEYYDLKTGLQCTDPKIIDQYYPTTQEYLKRIGLKKS